MEQEQTEIKAKIAELKARYAKLASICRYGARVSRQTQKDYALEIERLQERLYSTA